MTTSPGRSARHFYPAITFLMVSGLLLLLLAAAPLRVAGQAPLLSDEEQALLEHINAYRIQNGLNPLSVSPSLNEAAEWMSGDMGDKDYFSHTDSLGRSPFQRMAVSGYDCEAYNTWCGENLAAGVSTGSETFELWRNSPGHNGNMLNPNYVVAGIAAVVNQDSTYGWYWTLDMGGFDDGAQPPPTASPEPTPTAPPPTPTPPPPTETPAGPTEAPSPSPMATPQPTVISTPQPVATATPEPPAPTQTLPPSTATAPPPPAETAPPPPTATAPPPPAATPAQSSGRQFGQAPPTGTDEARIAEAPLAQELKSGWNRLEVGGQASEVTELLPVNDGYLLAVYAWDQGSGVWRRYLPGVDIPGVNTLTRVDADQVVWILATRRMVLRLPA